MSKIFHDATPNIPKVSEFSDVNDYEHWKKVVEIVKDNYEIPDKLLISIVNIRISGSIAKKFNNRNFETTEEMSKYMDEEFGHGKESTRNDDIDALIHPPASVKDIKGYIEHFEDHLSKLNGLFDREDQQVALFMFPLSSVIVNAMASQDLQSLAAAKRAAIGLGKMVIHDIFSETVRTLQSANRNAKRSKASDDQDTTTVRCFTCNKTGHLARHCKLRPREDSQYGGTDHYSKNKNHKKMNYKSPRKSINKFFDIREKSKN